MALNHSRCFNHAGREAVACCPACGRFFCRECVTEHEHKVICSTCLEARLAAGTTARARYRTAPVAQLVLGVIVIWVAFYLVGIVLMQMPTRFHGQTIWQTDQWP